MTGKCKFPDKPCGACPGNSCVYYKHGSIRMCRLYEWKIRVAQCPYDSNIYSPRKHNIRHAKGQTKLEVRV